MRRNAIGFGCAHRFCPSRRIHVCYIFMCVMCMCCVHVCGASRAHCIYMYTYIYVYCANVWHDSCKYVTQLVSNVWRDCVSCSSRCMHVACVCCNVLQCVAVCCYVLQCVVICCSVLQYVAVCYFFMHSCGVSVVSRVAMCCSMVQYVAGNRCNWKGCCALQCLVVFCRVLQGVAGCCESKVQYVVALIKADVTGCNN